MFLCALTPVASSQSFPYVDHPGGGSNTGWTAVGNVTFSSSLSQYQVGRTDGNVAQCIPRRTIAGLGTQPFGAARLQMQSNGTPSSVSKVLPVSATPQNTTYEIAVGVYGVQSCDPRGCGTGGPIYPGVQVSIDGNPQVIEYYPAYRHVLGVPKSIMVNNILSGAMYYLTLTATLGAFAHSMSISIPNPYNGNGGGILYVTQVVIYPRVTGTVINGECAFSLNGATFTNAQISAAGVEALAVACEAQNNGGNPCSGHRVNLKPDIIYPNSVTNYVGCGSAGTLQCDILDIE